jgi:ferritin-like protein
MSSVGYHEPVEELSAQTRDMHRAIVSLMEELEAVDWYNQRVDACADSELRAIIAHNRDEEKEHAAMMIEWIRRHDPKFDKQLRTYLFAEGSIVEAEHKAEGKS